MASSCSACRAPGRALSRCSQCKWTAYCSKTCQREHWKAGHRRLCALLQPCQRFRKLELQWWGARPANELQRFVAESGLRPQAMSFFGEVLFLLCGLKACVLLSNLPRAWRQSFAADVVRPSRVLQGPCGVALFTVGTRLETPAEYDLTGELVLASTKHDAFPLAERKLQLVAAAVSDSSVQLAETDSTSAATLVREQELASVLDYPVALSECSGDGSMVEVGYFLADGQTLLASYCAMQTAEHWQRVQRHFQQYQQRCGGVELELHTSQI